MLLLLTGLLAACSPADSPVIVTTAPAVAAPDTPTRAPDSVAIAADVTATGIPLRGDPAAAGLDPDAMDALLWRAWESRSDALLIARGDTILVRWTSDPGGEPRPIETMSVTKSIVSLGVGMLIDEGAITSLDQPVSTWFPQWADRDITLRQLLDHTSGLDPSPTGEIYASEDLLRFALTSEQVSAPGEAWTYNNNGANLAAAVASAAAGRPLDAYLDERLFLPMGLGVKRWSRDRAGNTHGMSGLKLSADDLLAVGRLMLREGRWGDEQLVPADWIAASVTPTDASDGLYGLQWWTVNERGPCVISDEVLGAWRDAQVSEDFIQALEPLKDLDLGDGFHDAVRQALGGTDEAMERWHANTWRRGLPDCRRTLTPVGYRANGWLGQHLVVLPEHDLVAVRQRVATKHHSRFGADNTDTFKDFPERVLALVKPPDSSDRSDRSDH